MGNYFILVYILIILVLGIRSVYLSFKLSSYININLPEKAKELGHAAPHSLKFRKLVYKKDDINDLCYIRLKKKSQNAETLLFLVFVSIPLLMLLLTIIGFPFGK